MFFQEITLKKGDEVSARALTSDIATIDPRDEAALWEAGTVAAFWETSAERDQQRQEVLIRFEIGAMWLDQKYVRFVRRPDAADMRSKKPSRWDSINGEQLASDGSLTKTLVITEKLGKGLLITDLIKGNAPSNKQEVVHWKKEGESLLNEETKAMFKALMGQDITELNRLMNAGGDITARNGQGQTMAEVARERDKMRTVEWLEHVAGAATEYLTKNRRSKLENIDKGVDDLRAAIRKPKVAAKAVLAMGWMAKLHDGL